MSRDDMKRRIPTSAELENKGALAPASDAPEGGGRPRGLLRFFRTGRFRVPDEVGARKHVANAPSRQPAASKPTAEAPPPQEQATATSEDRVATQSEPARKPSPAPRAIRISSSVRDRRGTGRTGSS